MTILLLLCFSKTSFKISNLSKISIDRSNSVHIYLNTFRDNLIVKFSPMSHHREKFHFFYLTAEKSNHFLKNLTILSHEIYVIFWEFFFPHSKWIPALTCSVYLYCRSKKFNSNACNIAKSQNQHIATTAL